VTALTHSVTGHRITTDEESVGFWEAAGYRVEEQKAPAKRAASKKSSSTKK
jgi:hypothetical protein